MGDAWQRRGLGFRLLHEMMDMAIGDGIDHAHADVLADNHGMRALARKLGCEIRIKPEEPFLLHVSKAFGLTRRTAFARLLNRPRDEDALRDALRAPG